jgi:3-oxoacyl-[acyl-carrier protein] reductase
VGYASKTNILEKGVKIMKNSVAVVTGASQGIGRSTAIRLAQDFSSVVLVARNKASLDEVAAEVRKNGADPLSIALDLSQLEAAEIAVKTTLDRYGRIDALLNIAGAVPPIDLFEMTDEQWKSGIELKLHGARRLTIRAWGALKESNGSVVFISGREALDPKPALAAVAATNAAIIALAKAFAEQGIKDGVQVNSIIPGAVMTGLRRSWLEKWATAHNMSVDEATKKFPKEAGISRFGQPEEIAELLGFMVSPAAKWMTGTSVRMDGGETKGI